MDNFDIGLGYDSAQAALERIRARVLLIGIESDWLFPVADVEALVQQMKAAHVEVEFSRLITTHGHDGFLAEPEQLVPMIRNFLCAPQATTI
jgi:homoserine O-acetyltransferase